MINSISIQDPIDSHTTGAIEVVVDLDGGIKRWCFFLTPQGATNCGDFIKGTTTRVHYGAKHMFVVSDISKEIIETVIMQTEKQGELEQCTLPIV